MPLSPTGSMLSNKGMLALLLLLLLLHQSIYDNIIPSLNSVSSTVVNLSLCQTNVLSILAAGIIRTCTVLTRTVFYFLFSFVLTSRNNHTVCTTSLLSQYFATFLFCSYGLVVYGRPKIMNEIQGCKILGRQMWCYVVAGH